MTKALIMTLCALSLFATSAMAQDHGGPRDDRERRGEGPGRPPGAGGGPGRPPPPPPPGHAGGGGPGRPPQPPPPGHVGGGGPGRPPMPPPPGHAGGGGPGRPPMPPPPGHHGGGGPGRPPMPPPPPGHHGGGWGGGPGRPPMPPPPPGHHGGGWGGGPGRPPMPPPPPYHRPPPPAGGYATVRVQQIPRTGGGTWLNVHFNYPINSDDLNIEVRSARLEIHEAYAVTAGGVQYTLFQLQETGVFGSGDSRGADLTDIPDAIQDIYIRAEAWGALADAEISVGSRYGMPSISVYVQQ